MSARAAVGIVHRRELQASADPDAERGRLADLYAEEHLRAEAAAAGGFVDEVVEPADTRRRVAAALWALSANRAGSRATSS
jgi:acetyl-CoA carboxylase carboxyltransferase component